MADKDDLPEKKADDAENIADAAKDAEVNDNLGLDLTADPEFLALAADFDAAIREGAGGSRKVEPSKPDAKSAMENTAPEAQTEEAVLGAKGPGNVEQDASPPSESEENANNEAAAVNFVLVEAPEPAPENAAPGQDSAAQAEPPKKADKEKKGFLLGRFGRGKGAEKPAAQPEKPVKESTQEFTDKAEQAEPAAASGNVAEDLPEQGEAARPKAPAAKAAASKYPRLTAPPQAAATWMSRLFDSLAFGGILVLAAVFLAQALPGLQSGRLLWFSDELRQADVLAGVFQGKWLQIYLNGQLYQEAPPLYFWFLVGLHHLLGLAGIKLGENYAQLLYIGAAVSGFLFLLATFCLARSTARLDRRGALAAGCVLLSVLFLVFFFHYSSLDLFFAAFIIFSHVFLFKALIRPRSALYMGLAFLCAAVALMSKGALGLCLPVLSAALFCLWRGTPGRLLRGDFLLGLVFAVLPAIIWLGSIWATGQHDAVLEMLREQIWVKAFGDSSHSEPWWYYLAMLPILWLPWSFIALALPWQRLFSPASWAYLKSARSGERQGLAFVWIFFLGSLALISAISHKQAVYLVPLMGPLAVLTGRAVLQLSPLRSTVLQRVMALFFFLLAVTFVLLPVYYSGNIPAFFSWLEKITLPAWELKVNGIFLLAVIMLGAACLLIGVTKARRPESTLLVALLGATLFAYPLGSMTMPSLDKVVSSQAASVELRRYADLGYHPVSFKVYSGIFSYYSGMIIDETNDWADLERMVESYPRLIVAMSASRWQAWTTNPGFTEIMRFWMLSNEYVLLLRNTLYEEPEPEAPELQGPQPESLLPEDSAVPEEADAPADTPVDAPANAPLPEDARPADEAAPAVIDPAGTNASEAAPAPAADDAAPALPDGAGVAEPGTAAPAEAPNSANFEAPVGTPPVAPESIPLPDGTPALDAPIPQDPFAPIPAE